MGAVGVRRRATARRAATSVGAGPRGGVREAGAPTAVGPVPRGERLRRAGRFSALGAADPLPERGKPRHQAGWPGPGPAVPAVGARPPHLPRGAGGRRAPCAHDLRRRRPHGRGLHQAPPAVAPAVPARRAPAGPRRVCARPRFPTARGPGPAVVLPPAPLHPAPPSTLTPERWRASGRVTHPTEPPCASRPPPGRAGSRHRCGSREPLLTFAYRCGGRTAARRRGHP